MLIENSINIQQNFDERVYIPENHNCIELRPNSELESKRFVDFLDLASQPRDDGLYGNFYDLRLQREKVKLFRIAVSTDRTEFVATSDYAQDSSDVVQLLGAAAGDSSN